MSDRVNYKTGDRVRTITRTDNAEAEVLRVDTGRDGTVYLSLRWPDGSESSALSHVVERVKR